MRIVWSLSLVFALSLGACARSQKFDRAQEVYEDYPKSYYYGSDKEPTAPSKRVEMLGQPKKRVVVFNFLNHTPVVSKGVGEFAADELRRELFNTRRLILPPELQSKLDSQAFVDGEQIRVAQLIREGRKLGVAVVVLGRISKIVFRQRGDEVGLLRQKQSLAAVDIEMKMFDIQSGREILAVGRSGQAASNNLVMTEDQSLENAEYRGELVRLAIRDAMRPLVGDIMKGIEKLSWQGKVAKIVGGKIYVNSGRGSGLVGGDILRVSTPGEDVYDPDTGAFLGRTDGQLKGTLEVVDFVGQDAAVAVVHTGGNVNQGDTVQLY